MILLKRLSLPQFQFLALAACLLPVGIFAFHSDWPPASWVQIHFAEADIGETILECSALSFAFALAYFLLPRILHRQMNRTLGRIHFWLNVCAFLLLLVLPIYYNLTFHSPVGEPKLDRFFRAFGASLHASVVGIEVLAVIQILFLANVLWSFFKGERTSLG
jgi:heme/copper-type cytochrome/quinol oxidase subunit 1